MKKIDLTGKRFHKLTVLRKTDKRSSYGAVMWECLCDCGTKRLFRTSELTTMGRKSCGCIIAEVSRKIHTTHGGTQERLYKIWDNMKSRCYRPGFNSYKNYGAKGIKICDEWLEFSNFREWALSNGYNNTLTIDRIDLSKNYEPSNCRWATTKEQSRNTSRNIFITINGETKILTDWCKEYNFNFTTANSRLKRGVKPENLFLSRRELWEISNGG